MKIKYFLPVLLLSLLFTFFVPLTGHAAAIDYDSYTGRFDLDYSVTASYLTFANSFIEDESQAAPYIKYGVYNSISPVDLSFTQKEGYTYNGYMTKWVYIEYDSSQFSPALYRNSKFYVENVVLPDGVTFAFNVTRNSQTSFRLKFTLQFNNYIASYTGNYRTYLIVKNDTVISTDDNDFSPPLVINFSRNVIDDYTGDLYQFINLEDSPGYEGTTINQNNQIINNIADQTEQQHQDSVAQTNAINNQTNQQHQDANSIMNGFDSSTGNDANNDFNISAAGLEDAEDSLFNSTDYDNIDYNQFNDFLSLTQVSGAILFVKSALEAIYTSMGLFAVPITIGLVLLVFTRLIGFQHFTSGGG